METRQTIIHDNRRSANKEDDPLNDTIEEIKNYNKNQKPKTHRSKVSQDFKELK